MRTTLVIFILVLFYSTNSAQNKTETQWPPVKTESKPFTRWWWFGSAVDKEGLTYNLEAFAKAGFGGAEITPIYGTKGFENKYLPYLSPEWMDCLSFTISEAKRLGLQIEMATGTGWPFGGPHIAMEHAASKLAFQTIITKEGQYVSEKIKPAEKNQENIAKLQVIMAFSDKGDKVNLTSKLTPDGMLNWMPGPGNWKIIALFNGKTQQKVKRPAPGGEGLVIDHFSPATFDSYTQRFNNAFLNAKCPAPAVFFNDSYEVYNADWSAGFLEEFKKQRGYSLEET